MNPKEFGGGIWGAYPGEKMEKKELNLPFKIWWNRLSEEEQNVLISMLFNMDGEYFRAYGVNINDEGKFVSTRET